MSIQLVVSRKHHQIHSYVHMQLHVDLLHTLEGLRSAKLGKSTENHSYTPNNNHTLAI